jgi:hypothetical protein
VRMPLDSSWQVGMQHPAFTTALLTR